MTRRRKIPMLHAYVANSVTDGHMDSLSQSLTTSESYVDAKAWEN